MPLPVRSLLCLPLVLSLLATPIAAQDRAQVDVLFQRATEQDARGHPDSARTTLAQLVTLGQALKDSTVVAQAHYWTGLSWRAAGRSDSAAAAFIRASEVLPAPAAWGTSVHPLVHAILALAEGGRRDAARTQLERLVAIRRAAGLTEDPSGAWQLVQVGMQYRDQRTPEGLAAARAWWEAALLLAELGQDQPLAAATLRLLADRFAAEGHPDSAATLLAVVAERFLALGDSARAATAYGDGGWALISARQPEQALAPLARARDLCRALRNTDRLASALDGLGRAYGMLHRGMEAGAAFAEAAGLALGLGDSSQAQVSYGNAANMYRGAGRLPEASDAAGRESALAHARGDHRVAGAAYTRLALVYSDRRMPDSVLVAVRAALPHLAASRDSAWLAVALREAGTAWYYRSQVDSAMHYLRRALAVAALVPDSFTLAGAHNDLGTTFDELGRPDSAMAHYRAALALHLAGARVGAAGTTSTNIGNLLGRRPETRDSALAYYRQGLDWQLRAADTANAGVTLGNIGSWFGPAAPDSAMAYYRRALAFRAAAHDRRGTAILLSKIGQLYTFTGPADSARATLLRAVPELRATGARSYEVIALADLAGVYHHDQRLHDLARAVAYYDSAMTLSARLAAQAGGDADRVVYREATAVVTEDWVLAWVARMREGYAPGDAAAGAFAAAERGRARALLELMRGGSAAAQAAATLAEEAWDVARVTRRPGTALLSYFTTRDTLLAWLARPGAAKGVLFTLPLERARLAALVQRYREALGVGGGAGAARLSGRAAPLEGGERIGVAGAAGAAGSASAAAADSAAAALAAVLFHPRLREYLAEATELVVVPHGPLGLVPFAALTLPGDSVPLGLRVAVRFGPSVAVLAALEAREADPAVAGARSGAVVVGNPRMPAVPTADGPVTLSRLPGAEAEGQWIARRLGVRALSDSAASEAEVRRRLPGAPLIHLATHGYAYGTEAESRRSFVALAPGRGEDGLFTVGELLDDPALTLSAELVVLSACQTGLGDLTQAEGTVGLQRAFLARGARSVLVSLWNVSDAATELLMQRFYAHWLDDRDHPSRAEALRRAQGDVRARPEFREPRFWGAFQLVGR